MFITSNTLRKPIHHFLWRKNGILALSPISKHRFEQIMSFLYFKDRGKNPSFIGANWWDKLDSIMSILRQKSSFYWILSTNITVDEVMIKFEGRTSQKITIPGKPILIGFKIFALADSGYIFNWECTKPGLNEGLLATKKCVSISISNFEKTTLLNPTQSIVIRLTSCLSFFIEEKKLNFHLFLDNLFTLWKSV